MAIALTRARTGRSTWSGLWLRLLTLAVSGLLALLAGELFVRLAAPQNLSGSWRVVADGLTVHRPNWTARHQIGERVVRYRFDAHGLRQTSPAAENAAVRILCLGDSLTFGWLLADEDTYVQRLQQRAGEEFGAGAVALMNAGHGGWGTSDYVRFVELHGEKLAPQAVVVFLSADDIGRSLRQPQYTLGSDGQLVPITRAAVQAPWVKRIANRVPIYNWLLEHSHLFQLIRNSAARGTLRQTQRNQAAAVIGGVPVLQSSERADPQAARRLGLALLERLQQWCHEHHCPLLVLTTGFHRLRGAPRVDSSEPTQAVMADLETQLASRGIAFADISEEFDTRIGGNYAQVTIPSDGHPNEQGAALIAELNWPYVRDLVRQLLGARTGT